MGRRRCGGPICETCPSIDVRRWHREARLLPGQSFGVAWAGGPDVSGPTGRGMGRHPTAGAGHVDAVSPGWRPAMVSLQRQDHWPILRAPGRAPLQRRRAFACRSCYGLPYASQREALRFRGLSKARKVRARLGGSANMFDAFPERPRGMRRRTYIRLRHSHDIAARRCGC
jgi:hypothetical protein